MITSERDVSLRYQIFDASSDAPEIGSRVCVYGQGGKTSLSRALATLKGLPMIELDAIFWLPNWVERDRGEMLRIALDRVEQATDGWIVDGNYSRIRSHLLPIADTVIWLNLPRIPTTLRVAKRSLLNAINGTRICGDNYETLKTALSPDSIIWYRAFHGQKSQQGIAVDLADSQTQANIYEIRSYRQLRAFYQSLGIDARHHLT